MNAREAKILALTHLSEWAWDCRSPEACRDMTVTEEDAKRLALAFEALAMGLYVRKEKLKTRGSVLI